MPKKPSEQPAAQSPEPPDFEQALERLEQIVHLLEDGSTGLQEAMARYEEGVRLLRRCHELLENAQRRIELLGGVDADGSPILRPFDDRATLAPEHGAKGQEGAPD